MRSFSLKDLTSVQTKIRTTLHEQDQGRDSDEGLLPKSII